jgi:hypothetical protein
MVIAIGAVLAAALFAIGEYVTNAQLAGSAATAAAAARDDKTYTGSILYMPDEGRTCHQLLFNNQTGRFTDNGKVDCVRAAYQSATPKGWSAARASVISAGFRQH